MNISVIVVVRNECDYIIECIQSIEQQFSESEKDDWELILVDSMSDDLTKEVAEVYLEKQMYSWRIVDNYKKTLAAGWNLGIKLAKGRFVCRPDAHSVLHKNYIKRGLELHDDLNVVAVGGVLKTKSKTFIGNIISEALSSKMCVGSSFRTTSKSAFSDTAVYAIYKKSIFQNVGYFDEELVRHQDNDMHKRIKSVGGSFYTSADMTADYYCRDSIKGILKQMYNIGKFLPDVFSYRSISLRHLAPLTFLLGNIFCISFLFHSKFIQLIYMMFLFLYFGLVIVELTKRYFSIKNIYVYINIIIIPLIHFAYGVGTLIGLLKKVAVFFKFYLKKIISSLQG